MEIRNAERGGARSIATSFLYDGLCYTDWSALTHESRQVDRRERSLQLRLRFLFGVSHHCSA